MAIYIVWQEKEYEFVEWNYTGGGEYDPIMKEKIVTKQALYSNTVNDEMIKKANDWIANERPEAKVKIK